MPNERPFSVAGHSAFGHGHAPLLDLRPELPATSRGVVGIDLTHIIHRSDVAAAAKSGTGSGGGGGGGGSTSFGPYTSGPSVASAGYNITIEFKGSWTQDLYNVFVTAANQLTTLIIGDVPNVTVYGLKGGPKTIDDILITAELGNIDGLNGVLGQAGPTSVRTDSSLPATATMKFDIVDVQAMGPTTFGYVVLHEMAHSLGLGSIWDRLGLVTAGFFTGANAVAEYQKMGGTGGIPVEQDGGSGTAGAHWDEELFNNELMTGYIDAGTNVFSRMSAASFADLNYVINPNYGSLGGGTYILGEQGYVFA